MKMKITIKRKTFLEGLEIVKDSIGKQTALPILKNVKLTAKEETLKLYTTNLSIGTTVALRDLSIISEGEVLCDAVKLKAIIKELPETEVKIETDEKGHLIMECEKSHFRLFTMPPEEFPSEPEISDDKFFPISDRFFQYLKRVRYAASKDEGRYNLNSVYLDKEFVATDGHRMAIIRNEFGFDNLLVPLDFVNIILKARNRKDGGEFQVGCSNNVFFLKTRDLILFGRLIDGAFPDYSQVIPKENSRYALIERKPLIEAIKRIMLMTGKNYEMKFQFWPFSLVLSSCSPELGDASEEMEVEYRTDLDEDQPFVICLNGRYLLDILEALEGEKMAIEMGNQFSPIKVEENSSLHILMPLRLVESEPQIESETEIEPDIEP
jgi:DNA polymerase-3 subunit beta